MNSRIEYTDDELIDLLKQGDQDAFNTLYHRYGELLYHFAFNILQDEDECADVVQDVFVWLWNKQADLSVRNLKSYLLSAVKYRLVRTIQASKRREEILASAIDLELYTEQNDLEVKELQEIIAVFQENLPSRARQIFQLSRNEHLSNKEIAARLNVTEKTVENQMTISLRKLRFTLHRLSLWFFFL